MTPVDTVPKRRGTSAGSLLPHVWLPVLSIVALCTIMIAMIAVVPRDVAGAWLVTRMPAAMTVALLTTIVAAVLGVALGALAATRGPRLDRALFTVGLAGNAAAVVWVALALSPALTAPDSPFTVLTHTTIGALLLGWCASLAVPLIALTLGTATAIARQITVASLGLLQSDVVRTLRSRGQSQPGIVRAQVFRRSRASVVTLLGLHLVGLFAALLARDAVLVKRDGSDSPVAAWMVRNSAQAVDEGPHFGDAILAGTPLTMLLLAGGSAVAWGLTARARRRNAPPARTGNDHTNHTNRTAPDRLRHTNAGRATTIHLVPVVGAPRRARAARLAVSRRSRGRAWRYSHDHTGGNRRAAGGFRFRSPGDRPGPERAVDVNGPPHRRLDPLHGYRTRGPSGASARPRAGNGHLVCSARPSA
ncbi:hypothetical protein H4V99_000429 [Cryobacterium sp. CG_9.6]|nr:hypothetical protein [Cryobacterium sp. CG_9.6]